MPPKNKGSLRREFSSVTNADVTSADKWLSHYKWKLQDAVNAYIETNMSGVVHNESLEAIFEIYKEPNEDFIGIDGTLQYIQDLNLEPEDPVVLAIAELLNSPTTGVFQKDAFLSGWNDLGINDIEHMRKHCSRMSGQLQTDTDFLRKIYLFSFRFLLEEGSRTIPKELAIEYWKLLIQEKFGTKVDKWCQFVQEKWNYAINRDQWSMLFNFLMEWEEAKSLEFYDETAAWPSIIDDFVEFLSES